MIRRATRRNRVSSGTAKGKINIALKLSLLAYCSSVLRAWHSSDGSGRNKTGSVIVNRFAWRALGFSKNRVTRRAQTEERRTSRKVAAPGSARTE